MRVVFIHEDDIGEVEMLPVEAFESSRQELHNISQFSDEHCDSNGYGWTDIFLRGEPKKKLAELQLEFAKVEEIIGRSFAKFDRVETGYGSHREPLQGAHAFGESTETIFYVIAQNELVENIWVRPILKSMEDKIRFVEALRNIGSLANLIMCDWSLNTVIRLNDQKELNQYLIASDERTEFLREALEKYRKEASKYPYASKPKKIWWKFWD